MTEHQLFQKISLMMILVLASLYMLGCAEPEQSALKTSGKPFLSTWTGAYTYDLSALYNNSGRVIHQGTMACGNETINCTILRDDIVEDNKITQVFYMTDCSLTNGATTDQLTEWGSYTFEKISSDTVRHCETSACDQTETCQDLN